MDSLCLGPRDDATAAAYVDSILVLSSVPFSALLLYSLLGDSDVVTGNISIEGLRRLVFGFGQEHQTAAFRTLSSLSTLKIVQSRSPLSATHISKAHRIGNLFLDSFAQILSVCILSLTKIQFTSSLHGRPIVVFVRSATQHIKRNNRT